MRFTIKPQGPVTEIPSVRQVFTQPLTTERADFNRRLSQWVNGPVFINDVG